MASNDAVFGLFAKDKASEVFKNLGKVAKTTAHDTQTMTEMVDKASHKAILADDAQRAAEDKLAIAQAKMNELQSKSSIKKSEYLVAQERVTAAETNLTRATETSAASITALTSAEARAAFGADTASTATKRFGENSLIAGSKMGKMFKTAQQGAAIFAGYELFKFGKESVKAAEEFQLSQAKLQTAIKNSGHSMTQYAKPVEELNAKFRKLGFTDSETADGLAVLTTAVKNPAKAISMMGTAADLARYKNMTLADSALIVAKGYEGQIKPLRALAIDIPVAAGGALKLANANKALAKAQAHLLSLGGTVSVMNKKAVKESNAVSTAQLHLNDITNKYGDPAKRTAGQIKAISAAQTVLNLEQQRGTVAHGGLQKAQEAVFAAQEKVNAAQSAGKKIVEALASAVKGQAANAAATFAGKQKTLNAEMDRMKVTLGTDLMPLLNDFADWAIKSGIPFMEHMMKFAKDHGKEIIITFGAIASAFVGAKIVGGIATFISSIEKITATVKKLRDMYLATDIAEGAIAGGPIGVAIMLASIAAGTTAAIYGMNHLGTHGDKPAATPPPKSKYVPKSGLPSQSDFFSLAPSLVSKKKITTATHTTQIIIHQHIAGSIMTQKQLIDTVHNGIAQNMKNSGKNPATIGK